MSFSLAGTTHSTKVAELLGFKDYYTAGKESNDNRRSGHDDVVALGQQDASRSSQKKPSRPRDNDNLSLGADPHLLLIDEHLCVFLYTRFLATVCDS